jgi:hypothetical protein
MAPTSNNDTIQWNESLGMRVRAFGSDYRWYLLRALAGWSSVWLSLFGSLVVAQWVLGRATWFDRRGVVACAAAAIFGALLRVVLELGPRIFTLDRKSLVINHCNWSRRKYPLDSAQNVKLIQMNAKQWRAEFRVADTRRNVVVVGTSGDCAELIAAHLSASIVRLKEQTSSR